MKRGLIMVLVLGLLVGMMSLSSFAAVRNYQNGSNYQNGGMMNGINSNYGGGMMNGNFAGRMNGNFAGRGGMMNGNNSGMMNSGMMGWNTDGTNAGVLSENAISLEAAYDIGKTYLEKELSSEYTLNKEGIATGDFYTFYVESNDKTVGMISVNALTNEVWLHNCRGLLQ